MTKVTVIEMSDNGRMITDVKETVLKDMVDALVFMLAGKAIFTLSNEATGNRFTYKVDAPKDQKDKPECWFVSVLTGLNNECNYSYVGLLKKGQFMATKGSKVSKDALSFKAFNWLVNYIKADPTKALPEGVKFQHEGRCGKCGKKLTTPESIELGLGPKCHKAIAGC